QKKEVVDSNDPDQPDKIQTKRHRGGVVSYPSTDPEGAGGGSQHVLLTCSIRREIYARARTSVARLSRPEWPRTVSRGGFVSVCGTPRALAGLLSSRAVRWPRGIAVVELA